MTQFVKLFYGTSGSILVTTPKILEDSTPAPDAIWNYVWHRIDGPAVIRRNRSKEWFINDRRDNLFNVRREASGPDYSFSIQALRWCKARDVDILDMSEEEFLTFNMEFRN